MHAIANLDAQLMTEQGQLSEQAVQEFILKALSDRFRDQHVLVLIPDHTRTLPLPLLFRALTQALADTKQLDFMVALGTHSPLSEEALLKLVGISQHERENQYKQVGLHNHAWDNPDALQEIGTLTHDQIKAIAGETWHPSLGGDVPVRINKAALSCDHILIVGPTFPHEVVGFSGGAKYLFPGISGAEMINKTHWLGALLTVRDTIGYEDTPVRQMIHAAAQLVHTPITLLSMVVEGDGLAGMFLGGYQEAFHAAVQLSSERHIVWLDKPIERVLSHLPKMYDELWVGAKGMYKLDPAVADGGEVVIYAPHLHTVSAVHGQHIEQVGYHVRDYFLRQWEQFKHVPLGVLAHSTHLKGSGTFEHGQEQPRIQVSLATGIAREDCEKLNLGYLNPDDIDMQAWEKQPNSLYVPKAGERLYRIRPQT